MTDYDPTKPAAQLQEMKQRLAAMQDDFKDADGNVIDLGYPVQYINVPDADEDEFGISPWNPERWGIVIALIKTAAYDYEKREESTTEYDVSVKVALPNVIDSRSQEWGRDEFTCDVKSVRVIQ